MLSRGLRVTYLARTEDQPSPEGEGRFRLLLSFSRSNWLCCRWRRGVRDGTFEVEAANFVVVVLDDIDGDRVLPLKFSLEELFRERVFDEPFYLAAERPSAEGVLFFPLA